MDDHQALRSIFTNTINPDPKLRNESEEMLKQLETNAAFILSLADTFMNDTDPLIQKVAIVYYKNSVIKNLKVTEFKFKIVGEIVCRMLSCNKKSIQCYKEILRVLFETCVDEELMCIFNQIPPLCSSNNKYENYIGLVLLLQIQEDDMLRYNKRIISPLYESVAKTIVMKMVEYLKIGDYLMGKMYMEYISKMIKQFNLPVIMSEFEMYKFIFNAATEIVTSLNEDIEDVYELKTFAIRFINKSISKAMRGYHKKEEVSTFIQSGDNRFKIYKTTIQILSDFMANKMKNEKLAITAFEYLDMIIGEAENLEAIKPDIPFLVKAVVLELYKFNEKDEFLFEDSPADYIKEKYNCYQIGIRNVAADFFRNLIKACRKDEMIFMEIFNFLRTEIDKAKIDPSIEIARYAYAAMTMICLFAKHITGIKKGESGDFVMEYIYPFLNSHIQFLQSSSCFMLQYFEGKNVEHPKTIDAFMKIMEFIRSGNEILKFDASHAIIFFFSNETIQIAFKKSIPEIVQSLVALCQKYDLESLSETLELITHAYSDEVSQFAPSLIAALVDITNRHLASYTDEKVVAVSGHLRIIAGLISAIYNPSVQTVAFDIIYETLVSIFKNKRSDFYMEAIDILVDHIFTLKAITPHILFLFNEIMELSDEEMSYNVDELTNLFDNFITYASVDILQGKPLNGILRFVKLVCLSDKDTFFDDDHACGCRIMESFMLIHREHVDELIETFVSYALFNRGFFENEGVSWIYSLNLIMQCFVTNPIKTLKKLQSEGLHGEFFTYLFENSKRFVRVHDKKTVLLFIGKLCELPKMDIDYKKLSKLFVEVLVTLPDAINNRNMKKKLEREEAETNISNIEDDDEEEYDEDDYYDSYDDLLCEDIGFESPLDNWDAFECIKTRLQEAGEETVGYNLKMALTEKQRSAISKVFSGDLPKQE